MWLDELEKASPSPKSKGASGKTKVIITQLNAASLRYMASQLSNYKMERKQRYEIARSIHKILDNAQRTTVEPPED